MLLFLKYIPPPVRDDFIKLTSVSIVFQESCILSVTKIIVSYKELFFMRPRIWQTFFSAALSDGIWKSCGPDFIPLLSSQWTLTGKSSLLMFPIYGCAAIIAPLYARISSLSFVCRGFLYMTGFYLIEFISGSFSGHSASVPGIISRPFSVQRNHPAGLCSSLVCRRTYFLKKYLRNLLEKSILVVYDCARENL